MMIISFHDIQQDTIPRKIITRQDSALINHGSVTNVISVQKKDTVKHRSVAVKVTIPGEPADTTSVCPRNSISDVTFYDPGNVVFRIKSGSYKQFPFNFIDNVRQHEMKEKTILIQHLKPGNVRPPNPLHADWMIFVILVAGLLYSVVRSSSTHPSSGFGRFFLFRGINDHVSRDLGGLFHWQSTILNFISFLIIGLFGYCAASYFDLIPTGSKGIVIWLIALGIISSALTVRHIACVLTGEMSGRQDVFREYLLGVYQSYRFGALFLAIVIILISYTRILPVRGLIVSGIIIAALVYLIRIIRLLIIFLNRNISIFYLILYLCALEILPVLIVVKYFTGLA
jgi:hypothetical protein